MCTWSSRGARACSVGTVTRHKLVALRLCVSLPLSPSVPPPPLSLSTHTHTRGSLSLTLSRGAHTLIHAHTHTHTHTCRGTRIHTWLTQLCGWVGRWGVGAGECQCVLGHEFDNILNGQRGTTERRVTECVYSAGNV